VDQIPKRENKVLIYPSVEELTKELNPGSIVLVSSMALKLMSRHLDIQHLNRMNDGYELINAPFYVLNVPAFVPILKSKVSGRELEIVSKPEAETRNKLVKI